jgi:hypothetical protein
MIYFIQEPAEDAIKIGYSTEPSRRLSTLQTSHPRDLELLAVWPGDQNLEKQIHERFAQFRIRGEWFRPAQELLDFISENSTNTVVPCPDGDVRLFFARPLEVHKELCYLLGTHRMQLLADDELGVIFGIQGKPVVLIDWLESMSGIREEALQQFRDALQ